MPPTQKTRILLVDDHVVMRQGLATLINAEPDMEVIAEASDGRIGVEKARAMRPDVVVMDVSLPRLSGPAATAEIMNVCPDTHIIALSMHEDRSYLRAVMEAGAKGYVVKRAAASDLIHAIRVVARGGMYLDPTLAASVMGSMVSRGGTQRDVKAHPLSEREEAVLRLIAQGYSNKEIAAQLSLSVKSVETYKARSMEKLSLLSRVDIVRYVRDRGWFEEI